MSVRLGLCCTWTCCLVSRRSCSPWTRWCPCCRSSPGSACRRAALLLTGAGGAGWSGEPEEGPPQSCGSVRGCRTWRGNRKAMRRARSWGVSASRGAPPTGTEPPLPLSAWARPGGGVALRSPADLEGGRIESDQWVCSDFDQCWKMSEWLNFSPAGNTISEAVCFLHKPSGYVAEEQNKL